MGSSTADMKSPQGTTHVNAYYKIFLLKFCHSYRTSVFYILRIVCITAKSGGPKRGQVSVKVQGGELGFSAQIFSYQVRCYHTVLFKKRNQYSSTVIQKSCFIFYTSTLSNQNYIISVCFLYLIF